MLMVCLKLKNLKTAGHRKFIFGEDVFQIFHNILVNNEKLDLIVFQNLH